MPPKQVSAAKAERHLAEVTAQKALDRKVAEALDRAPPSVTARVDRAERWQTNTRWGDLSASQLGAVMQAAQRGDIADFAELVEFAISTDEHLQSLYTTRLSRVSQAEYEIVPSPFGDPALAKAAAAFVSEQMARVENYDAAIHKILHAIAIGYSASEMVWAQDTAGINYVQRIEFRHPRRFRFSPQWTLRLWDRGRRRGADSYGESLDPRLWIVHEHQELAGYQGVGGVMNSCMWTWMFTRWVRKFWIGDVEKHGSPLVYATVKPNTPKPVRDQLLSDLENLSADHVGVLEDGATIVVEAAAQAAASKKHEEFMRFANEGLAKAWLGAGDAVDPGVNGARGAVETRMSATTDPRMVTDGKLFATSMRMSIIKQLISFNAHHIVRGVSVDKIPLPLMRMKTAHDEVRPDMGAVAGDAKATLQSRQAGRAPEVGASISTADKSEPLDIAAIVRDTIAGANEDRRMMTQALVALSDAMKAMHAPAAAPAKRARPKRPKASASGEPRQQTIEACETGARPTLSSSLMTRLEQLVPDESATPAD